METFTKKQIEIKVAQGENLIIFQNGVYNLTSGELALKHMAGRDATDAILAFHPDYVIDQKIKHYRIGQLAIDDQFTPEISKNWRSLRTKLIEEGYFETRPPFWVAQFIKFFILWSAMVSLVVFGSDNILCCITSALCGAALWHQAAFVAHDGGHNGISGDRLFDNYLTIFLADLWGGLSIGWWKKNHYTHHIVTNDPEHDPDIQHLPFLAVSTRFFKNIYSSYYKRELTFDAPAKYFVSIQHYMFYVLMMFGRFNLYVQSWIYLSDPKVPFRNLEIAGMLGFWSWYLMLLSYLPSIPVIIMYVLISHTATMFLHIQITISHFGMPTNVVEDENWSVKALRTTMDVECPTWMDWFHGGLQFQVVHHLFPRLPRHNLRKAQSLVMKFAKENGLTYHIHGFIKSNTLVLGTLRDVASQVKFLIQVGESQSRLFPDTKIRQD